MFRTPIKTRTSDYKIEHDKKILSIGSCFAAMMGERLSENKFNSETNPFGVIFNPISIFKLLHHAIDRSSPGDESYIENNGIWYNYDLHSELSHSGREALKSEVESKINKLNDYLKTTDYLIITLGTAYVYELNGSGGIVANCHKLPATNFTKRLLEVSEIVSSFDTLIMNIAKINSKIKVILTVSPVRHVKDTLELNAVSKSVLRLAAHEVSERFSNVDYFPSYEIMMDDLRDYRFYKADMLHPNEVAEKYIWEQFMSTYFSEKTVSVIAKWQKIKQAIDHRPFHRDSLSHKKFLIDTLKKLKALNEKMNLSEEIKEFEARIT